MLATANVAPFVFLGTALLAQSGPPPIAPELRARFGFDGPLVVKVGDGLGNLQIADVDGDGKVEAIAVDSRRARLVAVRVKGRETELQPIPTNGQISGYTLADVTGDGKPDLLLVDTRGRLSVRRPGAEPEGPAIDLGLAGRGVAMLTGDLDGDKKQDLVAVARGSLRTVTNLSGTPKLSAIEPVEDNAYSFHLGDFDADGKLDLVAVAPGANMNLRLRLGNGDGSFGAWRIFSVDGMHDVFPARTADGKPALATIAGSTRAVSLQVLQNGDDRQALDWWAFGEGAGGGKALPWALGDIDGDGDEDLLVARADRAQLLVHEWRDETFVLRTLPTLAGVAAIAIGDIDKDGKNDVVLASPEEDAVAWISGAGPLDRFPEQLAAADKPIVAAIDPRGGVLVITRNEKRDASLLTCAPGKPADKLGELGRLPADPARLLVADLGDAAGLELAFVVPGEGLRTLSLGEAGKIEKKESGKATDTAGFTKKLEDGACATTTVAGAAAMLAVRERFVRTFRLDDKGQVRVLSQDNGPDGMTELTLCAETDAGVLGGVARFYFDKKGNKLVRQLGAKTVSVEVPAFDFTHLVPHRGAVLLLSARGVLRVPFAKGPSLRTLTTHEPPIVRTAYWTGRAGDFDHDGICDLVVVDRHLPGVQILAGGTAGLQRALSIPVFETAPSQEPDNEPRELATGDLDGDGRTDFVLIAHDRILIYPQEQ